MITIGLGMLMKKQLAVAGLLVTLDQLVKVIIARVALGQSVVLIPGILRFEPYQNTNLNWFASMADIVMPIVVMVVLQLLVAAAIVLFYRYQRYQSVKVNLWLNLGFCAALAGVVCSFIDVLFWRGSLDYMGFLNWFIFDMKDIFLNVGWISIFIWLCTPDSKARKDSRASFRSWLRNGCKVN